jgi:hypothetical protein
MLVTIIDGNGVQQQVTWQAQDTINDFSANLLAAAIGNAAAPQEIAPANVLRAGFLFQNTSKNAMLFLESALGITSAWVINSGQFFPPNGNFPVPTGLIQVQGSTDSQLGDTFAYREWVNAPA